MGLDNVNDRPRAFVMFDRSARRASGRTCGGAGGVVYFRRAVKSEVRVFVCASSRVSVVAFAVLGAYLFVVYSTVSVSSYHCISKKKGGAVKTL